MEISYKYDVNKIQLNESQNGDDIEFNITFYEPEGKKQFVKVKKYFDENDIFTDLLVYTHSDKHIQMIVRKDFYCDFVLQLFKHQLLDEVKWEK